VVRASTAHQALLIRHHFRLHHQEDHDHFQAGPAQRTHTFLRRLQLPVNNDLMANLNVRNSDFENLLRIGRTASDDGFLKYENV
jgi:hypothetical protein